MRIAKTTLFALLAAMFLLMPVMSGYQSVAYAEELHFSGAQVVKDANTASGAQAKTDNRPMIILSVVLVWLAITAVGVYLGLSDKAVFYEDGRDVFATFIPFIIPPVFMIIVEVVRSVMFKGSHSTGANAFLLAMFIIPEAIAIGYVFKSALKQNSGKYLVAFIVTISKMLLSLSCLLMLDQMMNWDKNKTAAENWARRANAAIWLTLLVVLMKKLINGERLRGRDPLTAAWQKA